MRAKHEPNDNELSTRIEAWLAEIPEQFVRDAIIQSVHALRAAGMHTCEDLYRLVGGGATIAEDLQASACWLVGHVGKRRPAVENLIRVLRRSNSDIVRLAALQSLGFLGGARAREALLEFRRGTSEPVLRRVADRALGDSFEEKEVRPFLAAISDPDERPEVRSKAAQGLAFLGVRKAVPRLLECLHDPSAEVRFSSAFALGQLAGSEALSALREVAKRDKETVPEWGEVAEAATKAIGMIEERISRDG